MSPAACPISLRSSGDGDREHAAALSATMYRGGILVRRASAILAAELGVGRIDERLSKPERPHRGPIAQVVQARGAAPQQNDIGRPGPRVKVVDELGKTPP